MNMKVTRTFLLIMGCMILCVLSACEKTKGQPTNGTYVSSDDEIRIRVWESDSGPEEFIREAAKEYRKIHPNVYVDYIYMDFDSTCNELAVDGPKNIGPDLFCAPHDKLGQLVEDGLILPTEDPDYVAKSVLGSCSKALTYNNTLYGYPMSAETYALFYNEDLISEQELPKTFDELVSWTKAFNAKNPDKHGFIMDVTNAYYSIIFMTRNNNRLFGVSGQDSKHPNINTSEAISGYKYFQSLRNELGLQNLDLSSATCDGLFVSGSAAMHVTGVWNLVSFEKSGINFGVTTLPALPGDTTPAASFSGTRGMYVSAFSKHPKEAAEFARFLLTPEMQQLRFKYTGAMPAIDVAVNSKYIPGFLKQLEYASPMPSIPQMSRFWSEMGTALGNMWNGADVESELQRCNAKIAD